MNDKQINLNNFDEFKDDVLSQIKAGQPLMDKNGVLGVVA